jgi:hypothetical protein
VADPQETNGNGDLLVQEPDLAIEEDLDDDLALDDEDAPVPDPADEDDLDLDLDAAEPERVSPAAFEPEPAPRSSDLDDRIRRLEETAQALADAELQRDGRRVKRKVTAATGGAGVAAAIPVVLQLVGALNLSPELASGIAAAAALLGAFAAGWTTPERKPSLPSATVQTLLGER